MRYILVVLVCVICSVDLQAQSIFTSTGGGGDWTDPASWSENNQGNPDDADGIPDGNDDVIITSGNPIDINTSTGQNVENLTLNTGILTYVLAGADLDVQGTLTSTGTSSIIAGALITDARIDHQGAAFNISSGTLTIGAVRFDSNGTTTIDGTLSFTSTTGVKNFTNITVNSGGTWDNGNVTESFNIDGNIVANSGSTWTGCSNTTACRYTIRNDATGISGDGTVNMPDLRVNNGVTFTNTGNLVVTDNIDGATAPISGVFVNGNGGTLTLSDNGAYSEITFTLNTVGNTVIYSGGSTENIDLGPFYDLEINMDASTTLCQVNGADVTVDNNLTITRGRMRLQSANTLAVGGNVTLTTDGELEPNNASAVANITGDIIMTGGLYDHNNGDVNITDDFLISGGTFTFAGTSTLDADQFTIENISITLAGGTVSATSGSANGITLNSSGVLIVNAATLNVTSDLSISSSTAEFSPNNTAADVNITGDLLMQAGLYDHNNGDVDIGGDMTFTGGTMTLDENGATATVDATDMSLTNTTVTLNEGVLSITNASGGLTINTGSILTGANTSTLSVTNDLSIAGGEYTPNATGHTANIGGDLTMTTGEYDHNNGDVNITGDLIINGAGTMNLAGATSTVDASDVSITTGTATLTNGTTTITNATGGITVNSGELAVQGTATLAVTNDVTIAGGEFTPNGVSAIVNISGDLLMSTGTYDHNNGDVNITGDITFTGGTMTMNEGGTPTTLDATNFSITDAAVTLSEGTLTLTGGMTVSSGSNNVSILNTTDVAGTLTSNSGNTILNAGADVSANAVLVQGGTVRPNNTTAVLDVTTDVTVSSGQFDHNNGDVNISGDILISSTGLFTMNGATSTIDATDVTMSNGTMTLTEGTMTISNASGGMNLNGGIVNVNGAHTLAVTNNVAIGGGEFQPNNSEMVANIGGNLSMSTGTFDHNDGDINVTGDILITGGTMTMNEGDTPVNPSTIDATDMSVQTGSVTLTEGTLTLSNASGGMTVSNSGSITYNGANHTSSIAGDFDIDGTGSVDMNAGTTSFVNMDITTGGAINVANPTITSTGTITVDNGTFTVDGATGTYSFVNIDVNSNGTWNVTAAYDPTISGNLSNDGTFTGCSGVGCDYTLTSGSGMITGTGAMNSMSDIILNDGASYTNTNTGGFDISDALLTNSGTGTFVNGANGVMSYGGATGDFTVTNFTASAAGNSVTFNNTAANQRIPQTTDASNNYHNLIVNKADGVDVFTNSVITIDNQLTLTLGDFIMGGQNLVLADGATISGGGTTSYIQDTGAGILRWTTDVAGSFTAPIGDATTYAPITLTINSADFTLGNTSVDFGHTGTDHPNKDTGNTGSGGDDSGDPATDFLGRYWTVTGNNITDPDINASYTYQTSDVTGTEANMVPSLYRISPAIPGSVLDWLERGTVDYPSNIVNFENGDAFGDFYAMDNELGRLPIRLLSFTARYLQGQAVIDWVTASETDNDFFTIERSQNGEEFEIVSFVDGQGTNFETARYQVIDERPLSGRSYYRLKQTDFNGVFSYSEVVSVFNPDTGLSYELAPNPVAQGSLLTIFTGRTTETYNAQLIVRDNFGRVLYDANATVDGTNTIELPLPTKLSRGIYFVTLIRLNQKETKRLVIR